MIIYIISSIILLIGLVLLLFIIIKNKSFHNKFVLAPRKCQNYAILIPARNESNVISGLLKSIQKQSSLESTYIIVESKDDPTVKIASMYGAKVIVRHDLNNKHRKGFALDEGIKEILKEHKYDLYFIIDADNIIADNYISTMISKYEQGYEIVTAYHNLKNDYNVITACSCLVFSIINTLINKTRNKLKRGIIISASGFLISGDLINKWQGFPFNTLTEDYELSLYASANNLKTYYNDEAEYFDEQPTNFKVTITQRTRWVKGFFEARTKRLKDIKNDYSKLIGVTPYIFILLGLFIAIINSLILLVKEIINNGNYLKYLNILIICLGIIYIVLFLLTVITLIKEGKRINISNKNKIKACLFNTLFLLSFINCLFKSFGKI